MSGGFKESPQASFFVNSIFKVYTINKRATMRIQVAKEDKSFFERQGWIEFDGLFSSDELKKMGLAIDSELASRLVQSSGSISSLESSRMSSYAVGKRTLSHSEIVLLGRDLAISSPVIQKYLFSRKLVETVYQLIEKKPLRWAFDHVVTDRYLDTFLHQPLDIEGSISVGKLLLVGALIIDDKRNNSVDDLSTRTSESERALYPQGEHTAGRVLFFNPDLFKKSSSGDALAHNDLSFSGPSSFSYLFKNPQERAQAFDATRSTHESRRVLLFGWSDAKPIYSMNPNDSSTHQLKHFGYVFGDRLKETTHPVLYR